MERTAIKPRLLKYYHLKSIMSKYFIFRVISDNKVLICVFKVILWYFVYVAEKINPIKSNLNIR